MYKVQLTTMLLGIDAIILGASCIDHLTANMDACKEGPLDQRESVVLECVLVDTVCTHVGVVAAFDEAWKLDRGNCALYYR